MWVDHVLSLPLHKMFRSVVCVCVAILDFWQVPCRFLTIFSKWFANAFLLELRERLAHSSRAEIKESKESNISIIALHCDALNSKFLSPDDHQFYILYNRFSNTKLKCLNRYIIFNYVCFVGWLRLAKF